MVSGFCLGLFFVFVFCIVLGLLGISMAALEMPTTACKVTLPADSGSVFD